MTVSMPNADILARIVTASGVSALYCPVERGDWQVSPGLNRCLGLPANWTYWSPGELNARINPADLSAFERLQHAPVPADTHPVVRIRHHNGTWRSLRCETVATGDAQARLIVLTDLTESHQLEAALIDSQLRLRSLYDAAPVSIILWSREGRITDWNHTAEQTFGHTRSAVISQKLVPLLIAPQDYNRFADSVKTALNTNSVNTVVAHTLTRDGREIICEWSSVPLRSSKGGLQGIFSLAMDVTAKLAAEQALRQAKDSAEALSQAKSEFIATISHEFRTPLNGILGMSEVLLHMDEDAERLEFVRTIHDSGNTLLNIVNAILKYTEVDVTSPADSLRRFRLQDALLLFSEPITYQARRKGLALQVELAPSIDRCVAIDKLSLDMILNNVVDNALKFTEHGQVTLRADWQAVDDERGELRLSIEDTGIGMPAHFVPIAGTPFKQAEDAIMRKYSGVGLGLAITRKLIDRLGGHWHIDSEQGRGTCVRITLPCSTARDDAAEDLF